MLTIRRCTVAFAIAATAGACSTSAAAPGDDIFSPQRATTVEVTNNNWSDMRVYAVRLGMRYRIGTVPSMTTRRLDLPRSLAGVGRDVQLLVDPIGGSRSFTTGPMRVSSGEWIEFTIENYLPVSSYAVWAR